MQISFNRRRTYTFETDLTREEFFKRIAKTSCNKSQAKDLGLLKETTNKKEVIILKKSGGHFEVTKIVPDAYRKNGYKITGKGKLGSGDRKNLKIEIDYSISNPGNEMGFWAAVFFTFILSVKLFFEVIAGQFPTQPVDYVVLVPLAWIFIARVTVIAAISGFNNDIRSQLD